MTRLTTNRFLMKALRTFCCAGALTACSAWATVVNWQLSPDGASIGGMKDLPKPGYTNTARGVENTAATDASNQLLFKSAPESGGASEISAIKAAALSDKLQARDTDFQQEAPSTISNAQAQSAAQPAGAFDEQFVSVSNYQFASMASASGGAPSTAASSAGGDPAPVPEMSALFPIVGLIVAVSCTQILRRRRAAQLSARRSLA